MIMTKLRIISQSEDIDDSLLNGYIPRKVFPSHDVSAQFTDATRGLIHVDDDVLAQISRSREIGHYNDVSLFDRCIGSRAIG